MKKLLLILISALLLTACGGEAASLTDSLRPRIPEKRPTLPDPAKSHEPVVELPNPNSAGRINMNRLLDTINENVSQPNISVEDIDRGWYLAGKEDKKDGTPSTWVWIDKGSQSAWISPSALEQTDDNDLEKLCSSTAGAYAFSCIEREFPGCEHIPNSLCRCPDQTVWTEKQGCILTDKTGEPVPITSSDLKRGWYYGLPNEKKLDTPANWVWIEGGLKSRWQTHSPLDAN